MKQAKYESDDDRARGRHAALIKISSIKTEKRMAGIRVKDVSLER